MKKDEIKWLDGKVTFWDLDDFDSNSSIEGQRDLLKEDLVQVEFPGALLLDIGWYPNHSIDGAFRITVVRGKNWKSPLYESTAKNSKELLPGINEAISAIREYLARAS